jgi:hypothetical protein
MHEENNMGMINFILQGEDLTTGFKFNNDVAREYLK